MRRVSLPKIDRDQGTSSSSPAGRDLPGLKLLPVVMPQRGCMQGCGLGVEHLRCGIQASGNLAWAGDSGLLAKAERCFGISASVSVVLLLSAQREGAQHKLEGMGNSR